MSEINQHEQPRQRSNAIVVIPVILFAALAIVFAFSLKTGDPTRLPSALIGKPAPAFDFPPLAGLNKDGQVVPGVATGDLKSGEVTVVNFWASWCVPCIQEHPLLVELGKRGVKMVGINYKDPAPGGLRFLGRYGNPFAAVGTDVGGRGAIEWGVYGMPETFVIDKQGRIAYKHVGPITAQSLAGKMLPAIEAARSQNAR
ncbi:MAG: DsbE family thiol:disulfide interchange protein [Hyphomicrobiaceae bacterium]